MRPRRPEPQPWRGDRLGRDLREGLDALRRAEPGPGVWDRIAREIDPPRRGGIAHWIGALASGRHTDGLGARLSGAQRPALLLGTTALAFSLAFGNLLSLGGGLMPSACPGGAGCSWDRLSGAELAIQPASIDSAVEEQPGWLFRVTPRQHIDREARLQRLMAGREAFNRGDWLREPPAPARGAMAPALLGQLAMH